jgi:hypothetical protein
MADRWLMENKITGFILRNQRFVVPVSFTRQSSFVCQKDSASPSILFAPGKKPAQVISDAQDYAHGTVTL